MKKDLQKKFSEIYKGEKENIDEALLVLKSAGCSQLECVKIIMNELNISLAEADQIILNSETWKDLKDSTLKLRDDFGKGLTE